MPSLFEAKSVFMERLVTKNGKEENFCSPLPVLGLKAIMIFVQTEVY